MIAAWLAWLLFNADFQSATGFSRLWSWQLALFGLAWFLLPLALLFFWRWSLTFSAEISVPLEECLKTQSLAWAGRYMPGKAGFWFAKISVKSEEGLTVRALSHAALAEQALFVSAGLLVATLFLPRDFGLLVNETLVSFNIFQTHVAGVLGSQGFRVGIALMLIASSLVFVAWFARLLLSADSPFDWKKWLVLMTGHCALHIGLGLSLFPLLSLIAPDSATLYGWTGVVAVLALANIAGILAFFAPAGLGVRELVFAFCFANQLGVETALQIAAFLRLVTFVSDLSFSAVAWTAGHWLERQRRPLT